MVTVHNNAVSCGKRYHGLRWHPYKNDKGVKDMEQIIQRCEALQSSIDVMRHEQPFEEVIQSIKCGCDHHVEWIRVATGFHDSDCPLGMQNTYRCNNCLLSKLQFDAWDSWRVQGDKERLWRFSKDPIIKKLTVFGNRPADVYGKRNRPCNDLRTCPYFLHPSSGCMNRPQRQWKEWERYIYWKDAIAHRAAR